MEIAKYSIRDSTEEDCATLLRLNLESEHFLSPRFSVHGCTKDSKTTRQEH